jgi:chorismate dehydratase
MRRLRISAISYLNTAPLMWDFDHGPAGADFDISYTLPSGCATALREGTADIGIIPAAAYASIPGLVILPGVAIAAQHAVRSILLVSRKPLEEVRSVAMDTSSMTSVALCQVLLERWLGGRREYLPMAPNLDTMLTRCDAGLLIGDPALVVDRPRYLTLDLAEEWRKHTGKPFVFAFWAVREDALSELAPGADLAAVFQRSRDHGLTPENLVKICEEWAARVGLSEADVRGYLTDNIYYSLDSGCLEGLELYYRYAAECGALPAAPDLRFLSPTGELAYLAGSRRAR